MDSNIEFSPHSVTKTTSLVGYHSRGHCLIIGALDEALAAAEQIDTPAQTVLVLTPGSKAINKQATEDGVIVVEADALKLHGYLGTFDCDIGDPESPGSLAKLVGVSLMGGFDLVLDLTETPLLDSEVLPFGYSAPGSDADNRQACMAELSELQGEFEKPKYFNYDASICAHSRSSITACTNCIDVCGANAIVSDGDGIKVEPHLCQGCGSCATNCPSGAMQYAYPAPADALTQLESLLAETKSTVLYLYEAEKGGERLAEFESDMADSVLALSVEEVSSVGMDFWLAALVKGVQAVAIDAPAAGSGARNVLDSQAGTVNTILQSLQLESRVFLLDSVDARAINEVANQTFAAITPATFQIFNDKRQTIRATLDHMAEGTQTEVIALHSEAPFGQIKVDKSACTLCLACVTVCPAGALQDGETLPQLKFIESQCLQCGLCEQACPESAISLESRYLVNSEEARKPRLLNEETPFNCIVCNTPFATEQIIGRMQAKLADHWMFEDEKALRRLKMCEDCRVKDIFESTESGIDVHR